MTIIKTNIDTSDKKAVYRLTKSESARVQDVQKGTVIPVESYALSVEEKPDGSQQNVLAIVGGGLKISTISKTFINSFMECAELMEPYPFAIVITGGSSKNGRQYVDCELDCS